MGTRVLNGAALIALLCLPALSPIAWAGPGQAVEEPDVVQRYETADVYFLKAENYYLKQDFEACRTELDICLGIMPEHSEAYYLLARIDARQGLLRKALAHIQKAETYFDFAAKIRGQQQQRLMAELQRLRDEQDDLLAGLHQDLARASDTTSRQIIRTRIQEAERIKASLNNRLLHPLSQPNNIPADYHSFHADILARLGRVSEAEAQLRTAIETDPTGVEYYSRLTELYLSSGRPRKALEVIDEAEAKGMAVEQKLKSEVLRALGK
jgi:tetratricopeptide (TPR) repeat protein